MAGKQVVAAALDTDLKGNTFSSARAKQIGALWEGITSRAVARTIGRIFAVRELDSVEPRMTIVVNWPGTGPSRWHDVTKQRVGTHFHINSADIRGLL